MLTDIQEDVMARGPSARAIAAWPEESREAARRVIDQYGEAGEITESRLTWHQPGPWKRMVAPNAFIQHDFRPRTSTLWSR